MADLPDDATVSAYLRNVSSESKRCFNEMNAPPPGPADAADGDAAADAAPKPKPAAKKAPVRSLLSKLLPRMALPPTLPRAALPSAAATDFTMRNFLATREFIATARRVAGDAGIAEGAVPADAPTATNVVAAYRFIAQQSTAMFAGAGKAAPVKRGRDDDDDDTAASPPTVAGPSVTLFAQLDFAVSSTMMTAACRNLLRCSYTPDAKAPDATVVAPDADEGPVPFTLQLSAASASLPDATAALLRFAGFLRCGGGGQWAWAAMAAVDCPVDPDSDRVLQEVLKTACRHLTLAEQLRPDLFGAEGAAGPVAAAGGAATAPVCGVVVGVELLAAADVTALQTLIVVVGKFFKQANPSLLPL
jgi:hypothetical protein